MQKRELKKWKMDYEQYCGIACTAPCSMYGVLLDKELIQDPFYGMNDQDATTLADNDCSFSAEFEITEEEYSHKNIDINFYGLDTICEIELNGIILANVQNMHIKYTFDIKSILNIGKNKLTLRFSSPTKYFKEKNKRHELFVCYHTMKGAAHLRKALYMAGWDWGPKLPDMGIFRPVELVFRNEAILDGWYVTQQHNEDNVELGFSIENSECFDELYVYIDGQRVKAVGGKCHIKIDSPKLWWPNGYGEQYLYDLKIEGVINGVVVDEINSRIGLRTIEISRDYDKCGREFCFKVNGVKIFAMGANYVPIDNILSRVDKDKTERLLKDAKQANFNCLRVWGGGYYPDDYFYDLCDEMGLILWQDYMFACCNIWLTDDVKQSIKEEAIYNLKRIRNHASLGLLCGNNEMEDMVLNECGDELVKADYIELYEHMLAEISDEYAPQTFYWPSSPSCGGGFKEPQNPSDGDVHYWDVWHRSRPVSDYLTKKFRFCSEYGFESFPSVKTIESFAEKEDMNIFSEIMENHQKCADGNAKILTYIADNYLYPTSFEGVVYASQLNQADAIRCGVEHFRRIRGCCMGSIYWQFNDCWPVASWSSVDYFGRYKALHYAAQKFYAPLMLGICNEDDKIILNIANEQRLLASGTIKYGIYDNNFNALTDSEIRYNVEPLSSTDAEKIDVSDIMQRNDVFFAADLYDGDGNFVMRKVHLFVKPKRYHWIKPNISVDVKESNGEFILSVSSDVFAKSVEIDFDGYDLRLSDNYFDITSAEPVIVKAAALDKKTDVTPDKLKETLKIKSVYDIR